MDDFITLQSSISAALVATTRTTSQLVSEDLAFYRSLDSGLNRDLEQQNARLLGLATRLLGTATANTETVRPPSLRDVDAVEGNWRAVVDVVDSLLERADTALDEFTGAVKRLSPGADAQAANAKAPKPGKIAAQLRRQDIEKPQLLFDNAPSNRETRPFEPLLQSKPNASVPWEAKPVATDESQKLHYPHPYQAEIEQFEYPSSIYTESEPISYHPFESTTATFVDTEEALHEMLQELKQAKEIAIDLEHHDYRSYIGIVSLMQISTRDRDWVVDTLKPWRRRLQILNEVFTNPNIIKVLHGAFMDIMWLQRDLGLYMVGLFDTHYAARALGYQGGSLAFLLKKFADVDAQKQYQTADWRIRPLPQELFDYARSDTHYLLYIFDCMRNELIQRSDFSLPNHEGDKLWRVLEQSNEIALQRYEHPTYDAELGQGAGGWYKLLSRTPAMLTKDEFSVFRAVHQWRDEVAREQDDSVQYVMPNHQIFTLAREMPSTRATLLGVAQPATQTLRLRADELVAVINGAKEQGKDGPEMLDILNQVEPEYNRRHVKKAQVAGHSVAPYVPKPAIIPETSQSSGPLRSLKSFFWGDAFENSAHRQQKQRMSTAANISLSIPMPPLTSEVFADPYEAAGGTPASKSQPPLPASDSRQPDGTDDDNDNDVFVLKDVGKKRKRPSALAGLHADGMAANSDEVALSNADTDRLEAKAARKAARKDAKRAAKTSSSGRADRSMTVDDGQDAEEAPFDYENAPSMLNPPRETKEEMKARRKKTVDPYAKKVSDTAKGLPARQRERAGKSMTFGK